MKRIWEKKKDKFKNKFLQVTEKDLSYKEGEEDAMVNRLSVKLGKTEEEILRLIIDF